MSDLKLREEIDQRTAEIGKLEARLKALQSVPAAPVADRFDSPMDFMQAMREYHASERDRLDELQAIEAVLPSSKAKLQELQDRFDGIKSPVEQHFEEYVSAALEANKIFEQAENAYNKVFLLAQKQSELGHKTVFGVHPIDSNYAPSFPIFVCSSNKVSSLNRQQYRDYVNSGNVSKDAKV
jgi:uncharacterized coiled-coil DUF342 family protein